MGKGWLWMWVRDDYGASRKKAYDILFEEGVYMVYYFAIFAYRNIGPSKLLEGTMWLVVGLGLMGMLVGMLAGISSSAIVQPLIALLFAFVGGSVFVILSKLSGEDRTLAGKMVSALS